MLRAYAAVLAVAALGLAGALSLAGFGIGPDPWALGLVAIVALLSERQPVRIGANTEITVAVLPMLFAAVVFGPTAAMLVGAVGLLGDLGRPYERWLIWTALRSLSGGAAGLAALAIGTSDAESLGRFALAVVAAALAEAIVDIALGAGVVALRSGDWLSYLRTVRPVLLGTVPLYTPVIVALAHVYERISSLSVILFFGPAFAAHRFYRLYQEQRDAAKALETANVRLERANMSFATALVTTLDARDRYTAGHSAAVAIYARDIAKRLNLPVSQQRLAHLCGLVHDIGKVGLPAGILEKTWPTNS